MVILLLMACGAEPEQSAVSTEMDPVRLLSRMSLDLRGVRPSDEEIARIEADPSALDALSDELLADPRFEGRVRDLFAEVYLTRTESFPVSAYSFGLSDEAAFDAAVGEEPLRIIGRVASEDLPYTDVVLADWTMANPLLASILPLDGVTTEDADTWQEARYTDGRPPAGVLSTTGLWWRYTSTDSNMNRRRANAISRILLCNDYLNRPITFARDLDLLDEDAVQDAIQNDASCANCHNSLDPIASYLFGFWWFQENSALEISRYHPERELLWEDYTEVNPAWYGEAGSGLTDLAWQIAADPRFPECAVENVTRLLLRRDLDLGDAERLERHRAAFLDGGLTLRALFASVLSDEAYRAAAGTDEQVAGAAPTKMLTPDQLGSAIEDLTGFSWTYAGYDMLGTDTVGVRTLAGGVDGSNVTAFAGSPNATVLLVQERLSEAAASYAVTREQTLVAGERRLFTEIDFTETPDAGSAAIDAQILALQLRVLGRRVGQDSEELAANRALWEELYSATGSVTESWTGLLSALLRDPDFLLY